MADELVDDETEPRSWVPAALGFAVVAALVFGFCNRSDGGGGPGGTTIAIPGPRVVASTTTTILTADPAASPEAPAADPPEAPRLPPQCGTVPYLARTPWDFMVRDGYPKADIPQHLDNLATTAMVARGGTVRWDPPPNNGVWGDRSNLVLVLPEGEVHDTASILGILGLTECVAP